MATYIVAWVLVLSEWCYEIKVIGCVEFIILIGWIIKKPLIINGFFKYLAEAVSVKPLSDSVRYNFKSV